MLFVACHSVWTVKTRWSVFFFLWKVKSLSAFHTVLQHIWDCSTNCWEVYEEKKGALPPDKKLLKMGIKVRFLLDCVNDIAFLKRNKPMVKLGPALKKQLTHLSLCTLGKTPRQSQKSSTVLMKPSEQALSNAASLLLPCMREHATQARESSDQRSVCPTGRKLQLPNQIRSTPTSPRG